MHCACILYRDWTTTGGLATLPAIAPAIATALDKTVAATTRAIRQLRSYGHLRSTHTTAVQCEAFDWSAPESLPRLVTTHTLAVATQGSYKRNPFQVTAPPEMSIPTTHISSNRTLSHRLWLELFAVAMWAD